VEDVTGINNIHLDPLLQALIASNVVLINHKK
jgi:hypothetical protein